MIEFEALMEVLRGRRSVRMFKKEPVGREMVKQVIEAASWAPSASNRQDWEFTVVESHSVKRSMGLAVRRCWDELLARPDAESVGEELRQHSRFFSWFARAPLVIAISAREPDGYMTHLCGARAQDVAGQKISGAMAAQNLMLAAHALGLGSCCLTAPLAAEDELKSLLGLGRRRELVCLIALGWPAGEAPVMPRKKVAEVMRIIE